MISPFKGSFRVTCERGWRNIFGKREYHKGLDLVGIDDTTVYAVGDGNVSVLYETNGFGKYVRQTLADGRRIYYAHLDEIYVKSGKSVKAGESIGKMGATGKVTGAHLHLELRPKGVTNESLDICEYTGIVNKRAQYCAETKNRFSYDDIVEELMVLGIVTKENMVSWELMLSGRAQLKCEYVRTLLKRCCEKISKLENERKT
ncbi:MAG: M23 family metallopeptidase [Ruminococcaceae bacterium]|nr:M23 family metallopeptidase [Oscillospiraceae bacterium]